MLIHGTAIAISFSMWFLIPVVVAALIAKGCSQEDSAPPNEPPSPPKADPLPPSDAEIVEKFKDVSRQMLENIDVPQDLSIDVQFHPSSENNAYTELIGKKCEVRINHGIWKPDGGFIRWDQDAEFAAVLGHEIGHCLNSEKNSKIRNEIRSRGKPHVFNIKELSLLAFFEREFELEEDRIGLELMLEAGFDPFAAADIYCRRSNPEILEELASRGELTRSVEKLAESQGFGLNLDTHPSNEERCLALSAAYP